MIMKKLAEVATITMGLSPKGQYVSSDPSTGLPLLNGPTEFGPTHPTAKQWTSRPARIAEPQDILFCVRGSTTGRMNRAQQIYAIGRGIAAIRGFSDSDTEFIFYAITNGLSRLLSLTSGSVFPNLSRSDIRDFEIHWPDSKIRAEIAATLGALDGKIESNRRAVGTISDLLDAISESNGADLPNVPLGDIATSIKDSVNPLKLGDAPVDHFSLPAFDSGARPERVGAASIKSNKLRVPKSAILISRLNPRFNRTWWASAEAETSALASTEFLVLTSEDALELAAVWLAVRDPFFREELPKRVTGTSGSHQRVRPDDLLTINVPDFRGAAPEVKQTTLGLLMRSESLRIESDRLSSLRDALLPELLSGHIRVPVSEVAV